MRNGAGGRGRGVLGEVPKKSWVLGVAQRGDWKVMC